MKKLFNIVLTSIITASMLVPNINTAYADELPEENTIQSDLTVGDPIEEEHQHSFAYTDNMDGTHTVYCRDAACGFEEVTEEHSFNENGECACGLYNREINLMDLSGDNNEVSDISCVENSIQTLIASYNDRNFTATGHVPDSAWLKITEVDVEDIKSLVDTERFRIREAYDLKIIVGDEEWQPEPGDDINITIENIQVIKSKFLEENGIFNEIAVMHIDDNGNSEELRTDYELNEENTISFTTPGFSTFVIGDVTYNSDNNVEVYNIGPSSSPESIKAYLIPISGTSYYMLGIEGTGQMPNYSSYSLCPWNTYKDSIQAIIINNGVTCIGNYTFRQSSNLTTILLPSSLTSIGDSAFSGCANLTLSELPNGLTTIGEYAFKGCTSLALTSLPNGLTSIGEAAFQECTNLHLASMPNTLTTIPRYAFYKCTNLALTTLPDSITTIKSFAFADCSNLALTSLSDHLTTIETKAFYQCTNLALTSLPDSLTSIGSSAFASCSNMPLESLPDGIETIEATTFQSCSKLALTSLPAGLTSIGNSAFSGCEKIALTSLPDGITSLGTSAFSGCKELKITSLPSGVTSLGYNAFSQCSKIESMTLPEGLTSIASYVFNQCIRLKTLSLPSTLTKMSSNAIGGCSALKEITLNNVLLTADYTLPYTYYHSDGTAITSLAAGTTYNETIYKSLPRVTVTFELAGSVIDTQEITPGSDATYVAFTGNNKIYEWFSDTGLTTPAVLTGITANTTFYGKETEISTYAVSIPAVIDLAFTDGDYRKNNASDAGITANYHVPSSKQLYVTVPTTIEMEDEYGANVQAQIIGNIKKVYKNTNTGTTSSVVAKTFNGHTINVDMTQETQSYIIQMPTTPGNWSGEMTFTFGIE